jgi:hypothetical protein
LLNNQFLSKVDFICTSICGKGIVMLFSINLRLIILLISLFIRSAPKIVCTAQGIFDHFNQLNSTEIWTEETIVSTIKQIKFYWDAGFFTTKETVFAILGDLQVLMESIKLSCDAGYKFSKGNMTKATQTFYSSDLMIGNNAILAKSENFIVSFISYSTFNFMQTTNQDFNAQNEMWMNNIISKSTLISKVAVKQRNQFFRNAFQQLKKLHQYIVDTDEENNVNGLYC